MTESGRASGSDLPKYLADAATALADEQGKGVLCAALGPAIEALNAIRPQLVGGEADPDISGLLDDTVQDLLDCCLAVATGRERMAYATLRGVMEGLFMALLYREQRISLALWARSRSFVMVHTLLEEKSEFHLYYSSLLDDLGFKQNHPGLNAKVVFRAARDLYDLLSDGVHKKRHPRYVLTPDRSLSSGFEQCLADVLRVFFTFLECTDDLPSGLTFPSPRVLPQPRIPRMVSHL